MNHTTLIGRLGQSPTLRYTDSGKAVAEFSLAVPSYQQRKNPDADPDWFYIVAWGSLAEAIATNKSKGDQVAVSGRLTPSSYEKDGVTHRTVKVTADEVEFLARKRTTGDSADGAIPADTH